ncbi:nucleotide exchange factor SIL1 [Pseudohyphozyma bogoriensis]|nr:nucleotide exchange factor SIL1 [Pseudohyphozyma bogoriensis]
MDQQSLLRWGIEHAAPGSLVPLSEDIKAGKRPDLNSDVLRAIMGTTDADRMRECVEVIEGRWVDREGGGRKDGEVTKGDRELAWDDLEMLIEDLDNANNLKVLNLWEPIVKHLTDSDEDIVMRACWVCGTAIQNNPQAQVAFFEFDPLPTLLPIVTSSSVTAGTRSKAMYCLSALLKHFPPAVAQFNNVKGWAVLNQSLQDPSVTLRSKAAFLLSQQIVQSTDVPSLVSSLRKASVISTITDSLSPTSSLPTGPDGDEQAINPDYKEKALRVLVTIVDVAPGALIAEEKKRIAEVARAIESEEAWDPEEVGLAASEWKSFKSSLEK